MPVTGSGFPDLLCDEQAGHRTHLIQHEKHYITKNEGKNLLNSVLEHEPVILRALCLKLCVSNDCDVIIWGWRLNIFIMSAFFSTPKSISVLLFTKHNHLAVDVYQKANQASSFSMLLTPITIFLLQ